MCEGVKWLMGEVKGKMELRDLGLEYFDMYDPGEGNFTMMFKK